MKSDEDYYNSGYNEGYNAGSNDAKQQNKVNSEGVRDRFALEAMKQILAMYGDVSHIDAYKVAARSFEVANCMMTNREPK